MAFLTLEDPNAKIKGSRDPLGALPVCWHFIGHLQSNKTRQAAMHFDWVQTIDRLRIALIGDLLGAAAQGVEKIHAMNIGGGYDFPFGRVKMVNAVHGGRIEGAAGPSTTTSPCAGYVIHADGIRVYHAGDTALTTDMQLLEGQVDVALLPIGDNFTMGPDDAARAVEMIRPGRVVPIHYGTWPIIEVDPQRFVDRVGDAARVRIMEPGATMDLA